MSSTAARRGRGRVDAGNTSLDLQRLGQIYLLKTKKERLEVLQSVANISDTIPSSVLVDEEQIVLPSDLVQNKWRQNKERIEQRTGSWGSRFSRAVDGLAIIEVPKTPQAVREQMLAQKGWVNIKMRPPGDDEAPCAPLFTKMNQLKQVKDANTVSNYCFTCWGGVSPGPNLLKCAHCSVIAHVYCVSSKELKKKQSEHQQGDEESSYNWSCSLCIADVLHRNVAVEAKFKHQIHNHRKRIAILKLQSFCRMAPRKRTYLRVRKSLIALQRYFRIKMFRRKKEAQKKLEKKCLRVRLHGIEVVMRTSFAAPATTTSSSSSSSSSLGIVEEEGSLFKTSEHKIGECLSLMYDSLFTAEESSAGPTNLDNASADFMEVLAEGHQSSPSWASESYKGAKRKKGSMFLTISLHERPDTATTSKRQSRGVKLRQLFRIDFLLEQVGPLRPADRRGLQKHGAHPDLDFNAISSSHKAFMLASYKIASGHTHVLFPFVTSETEIRFTMSEATESWPKCAVRCQTQQNLFQYLLWNKCGTFTADGIPGDCVWESMPSSSEDSRLVLFYQPKMVRKKSDTGPEVVCGSITYSALPLSSEGEKNHSGQVSVLSSTSHDSSRTPKWLVLVDNVLYVYESANATAAGLRPEKSFHVDDAIVSAVEEEGIIKVKSHSDVLFLLGDGHPRIKKGGMQLFKKLYKQSKSNKVKDFSLLLAFPNGLPY